MVDNGTIAQVNKMVAEMEMVQAQDNGPQPVFDFSQLSFVDSQEMSLASADFMQASISNNSQKIEAALQRVKSAYAKVLVSVPREWLVKDAPEHLDWSDPNSINWLQAIKAGALRAAYNQQYGEAAKN